MGVSKYLFEEEKIERIKKHREYSLNKDYRMVPKNFLVSMMTELNFLKFTQTLSLIVKYSVCRGYQLY